jgi:prepilin-type N-terminal cleavage/methylation domain-containing protein
VKRLIRASSAITSSHPPRPREEAFTLIELMVVILIIAVLVAIAVPVYLGLEARADKTVAEYNIKAAEEIHTHIWYSIIEDNFFPAGGECYVDGANPVNALYVSTRETKIPWVDMNGAGSLAKEDSSGMLASLSPNPVLAQVSGGFQFSINGYYKNGALIENGGGSSDLSKLPGKVAVLYNTYYLGGKWYQNPDHKYLSMMVVEKAGTLHILTFHQGSVVTSEDFVWSEPDKVNFSPGPSTIDQLAVNPGTLNVASNGSFNCGFEVELTVYPDFNVNSINMSTVTCGNAHATDIKVNNAGKVIIKFDRQDLTGLQPGNSVPLTVHGSYTNGDNFSGTTNVKVINNN